MTGMIYARDFSSSTTDVNRENWTPAKFEHLIAALDGREVLVEVDRQTGHVQRGRLVGYSTSGLCGGASARVFLAHEHGETHFLMFKIGAIVDLGTPEKPHAASAKWDALDRARKAQSEALRIVREREEIPFEGSFEVYGLGRSEYVVRWTPKGARSYESQSHRVVLEAAPVA